jgi:hypothetical protein
MTKRYMQHFLLGPLTPPQAHRKWWRTMSWQIRTPPYVLPSSILFVYHALCKLQPTLAHSIIAIGPFLVPWLMPQSYSSLHTAFWSSTSCAQPNPSTHPYGGQLWAILATHASELATKQHAYCQDIADSHAKTAQKRKWTILYFKASLTGSPLHLPCRHGGHIVTHSP